MDFRVKRALLALVLFLLAFTFRQPSARAQAEVLEPAVEWVSDWVTENGGRFIFEYFLRKGIDAGVSSVFSPQNTSDPQRDVKELKRLLTQVSERDQANRLALNSLRDALDREAISRVELRTLVMDALNKMDARLAKVLELLEKQQEERAALLRSMAGMQRDLNEIKRWTPDVQAVKLAVAGFKYLEQGDPSESIKLLKKANAYDERDPGIYYGIAMAYKTLGDEEKAEIMLTRGIAAEKLRVPASWFARVIERHQGESRRWLSDARHDAIHGVLASGEIRVPREILPYRSLTRPVALKP
jgi:tetratricopeptide (TPR) repeat protein